VDPRLGETGNNPASNEAEVFHRVEKEAPPHPMAPQPHPLQGPRCGEGARRGPRPNPPTRLPPSRERPPAGLLRGLERLHQEGLCPRYGASSECGLDEREKSSLRLTHQP